MTFTTKRSTPIKEEDKMTDFSQLSMDDLLAQQEAIAAAMEAKKGEALAELKQELLAIDAKAAALGSSALELLGAGKAAKGSKPKAPPKYAHPENPAMTWSGRGRQPEWLVELVNQGASKDDFLIDKAT